jgi:hypothetical protein
MQQEKTVNKALYHNGSFMIETEQIESNLYKIWIYRYDNTRSCIYGDIETIEKIRNAGFKEDD